MKKLTKNPNAPAILSSQKAIDSLKAMQQKVSLSQKLTRGDVDEKIYGDSSVKTLLLKDQLNLCAYCESYVLHVSSGEKDHFRPVVACCRGKNPPGKKAVFHKMNPGYYWLAYDWNNLIFSCEKCNHRKSYYFPLQNNPTFGVSPTTIAQEKPLLINPYVDDPSLHIEFNEYIACPKTKIGEASIEYYDLNREELKVKRRERWKDFKIEQFAKEGLKKNPSCKQFQEIVAIYDSEPEIAYSGMITMQKK